MAAPRRLVQHRCERHDNAPDASLCRCSYYSVNNTWLVLPPVMDVDLKLDERQSQLPVNSGIRRRIQLVDATVWLNISAGVWKPSVFLGLWFNCLANALSCACE
jgi:hypothetical protein